MESLTPRPGIREQRSAQNGHPDRCSIISLGGARGSIQRLSRKYGKPAHLGIHLKLGAICNGHRDVHVKSSQHRYVAECGPLPENWIDGIEDDRQRDDTTAIASGATSMPKRRHPWPYPAPVFCRHRTGLPICGPVARRSGVACIDIVTSRKPVIRHERHTPHRLPHRMTRMKNPVHHESRSSFPLAAASTQAAIEAIIGR